MSLTLVHRYHLSLRFVSSGSGTKVIWLCFPKCQKKVGKCFVNVMLTPWQLLMRWFIAAKHVYMGVRGMCSEFVSALLTTSSAWWKKDLIPYRLHSWFNGVHVHGGNTLSQSIHNNSRQNQYQSCEGKSPEYLWVWPFPATGTPKIIIDTFALANVWLCVRSL